MLAHQGQFILATALYSIMQILFSPGSTLNVNSVMSALQLAWRHLQHMDPVDEEQVMIQQDLIGFFNSVPHSRICSALQLTLDRLQEQIWPFRWTTKQAPEACESSRGSNTKVLRIQHVMELTEFLLQSAYFKVGLDTYCQTQGACMGPPLAPVLCALVAAEQEFLTIPQLTHPPCGCRSAEQFQVRGQPMLFLASFPGSDTLGQITFPTRFLWFTYRT